MKNISKEGYLLSLDASTKVIGFCIWDKETDTLVKLSHTTLPKTDDFIEKTQHFKTWIDKLLKQYPLINEMVVERIILQKGAKTSIGTLVKLAVMNFVYQYICHEAGLSVCTISIQQARWNAFEDFKPLRKKRAGGKGHKEQVFDHVLKTLGKKYFPIKIISRGKNKGKERFEDFCMDMSDAYTVCRGFLNTRDE